MFDPATVDPALVLALLVGTVLPVLVGLVTTRVTHPGAKGLLLATLAAVTALAAEALAAADAGTTYDLGRGVVMALQVWVVAVATHYGLLKPSGVSEFAAVHGVTPTREQ